MNVHRLLLIASFVFLLTGCKTGQRTSSSRSQFYVTGVDEGSAEIELLDPVSVASIVDMSADRRNIRLYSSLINIQDSPESSKAEADLLKTIPGKELFTRSLQSRSSIRQQIFWFLPTEPKVVNAIRRCDIQAVGGKAQSIADLGLAERVMNTLGYADSKFESLRRAVQIDMQRLTRDGKTMRSARLWLTLYTRQGSHLSITLYSDAEVFDANVKEGIKKAVNSWVDGNCRSIRLSAAELQDSQTFRLRFVGDLCLRTELLPIGEKKDGTLVIVGDINAPASDIWK